MALTSQECAEGARQWALRMFVQAKATATVGDDALEAAFADVDVWVDDNKASYNGCLPEPFKSAATEQEKATLLAYVVLKQTGLI